MIVAIGSDHRGIQQRHWVAEELQFMGHEVIDMGTHTPDSCDYPDIAFPLAQQVGEGQVDRGVLICGTGIGVSIVANKARGVRAALCHDLHTAEMSRQHNDANVLCLPGEALDERGFKTIVNRWMTTDFEGGRHQRRVDKIAELDR